MTPTTLDDKTITEALSSEYGRDVRITPIGNAAFKTEVADATLKFLAPTAAGEAGFLVVSGAGNPHLVQRGVDNILAARSAVSARTAAPILPPVTTGQVAGRSFAVWPRKPPFLASNRVVRRLKGRFYAGRVTRWVADLCRETQAAADPDTVLQDLSVITGDGKFPDDIRNAADAAAARLREGKWRPLHCLHHGDFWAGNLLMPSGPDAAPFYVIDWAGMRRQGYPFLDLARMLMSLRCSAGFNANAVENLCRHLGCEREDATAYILSACGNIGANLEYFPPDRYRAATLDLYRFIGRP